MRTRRLAPGFTSCYHELVTLIKLEKELRGNIPSLYGFAGALVSSGSGAEKVVSDAFHGFFVEEARFAREFLRRPSSGKRRYMGVYLHGKVFAFGRRAAKEVELSPERSFPEFYKLSLSQRAAIFLKHKTDFNYEELEEILGMFKHEIVAHLFAAREHMIDYLGITPPTEKA